MCVTYVTDKYKKTIIFLIRQKSKINYIIFVRKHSGFPFLLSRQLFSKNSYAVLTILFFEIIVVAWAEFLYLKNFKQRRW